MFIWENMPAFIIILHVLTIIVVLFVERKRPVSTISWIFTLTFLPVLGVLLYVFLGTARSLNVKRQFQKKQEIDKQYNLLVREQLDYLKQDRLHFKNPALQKYRDMIVMHTVSSDSLYSEDNSVELITSARVKYDRLFEDIRNAKKTINVMYYIFRGDETGRKMIALLAEKAREGVEVRFIYDSFGNLKTKRRTFEPLKRAGGKVVKFLPNPFVNLLRVNYRNHRKIVVIDGEIGYLGGINVGNEYMGMDPKKSPWRDTHLRITGSSVVTLQLRFLMDWWYIVDEDINEKEAALKFFSDRRGVGNTAMQIVSSGPDSPAQQIKYGFLKMIHAARQTLYIQTPYLIPDDSILDGLKMAVQSGVDVRVMIPGVPDKKFVYYATLSYVEELLQNGVKVYAYHGFLHSKMMVADSAISTLGTTNMDLRGFSLAFEVNAFLYDEAFSTQCSEVFLNDMASCRELNLKEFRKRGFWCKIKESIFRLLSPLM